MSIGEGAAPRRGWQGAFWLALAAGLTLAWMPHPPHALIEVDDKIQHMLGFGALAILACQAWPGADLLRIAERLSFVGAMVEVVQSIPALHRDCDIMDWVADTAVVGGVVLVVWAWRRPHKVHHA